MTERSETRREGKKKSELARTNNPEAATRFHSDDDDGKAKVQSDSAKIFTKFIYVYTKIVSNCYIFRQALFASQSDKIININTCLFFYRFPVRKKK